MNTPIDERDCYRIGRHFLDGGDTKWIATREEITEADAQAAWEFCRERLSAFFSAAQDTDVHLLTDEQLQERAEDCVRLLLHWYETLSANARLAGARSVNSQNQGPDEDDNPSTITE